MGRRSGGGLPPGEGSLGLGRPWAVPGKPPTHGLLSVLQVDRTEVVGSCLHPTFSKVFTLEYCFAEAQRLRFEVYDSHGPGGLGCQDDDFLGGVECTLGQVGALSPAGQRAPRPAPRAGAVQPGTGPAGPS